jgi:hypothetical protein
MKAVKTPRRRVTLAAVVPSLQIELDGDWRRYSCLVAKVFGVQDLVTIAGDNHGSLVRLKLAQQPPSPVAEMAEAGS